GYVDQPTGAVPVLLHEREHLLEHGRRRGLLLRFYIRLGDVDDVALVQVVEHADGGPRPLDGRRVRCLRVFGVLVFSRDRGRTPGESEGDGRGDTSKYEGHWAVGE